MVYRIFFKSIVLISGIVSTFLIIYFGLNYSGFCFAEMRYLSDEEKIRSVFNYQNNRTRLPVYIPGKGSTIYQHIKYKSFDEYIKQNPDCCTLNPGIPTEVPPARFIDSILGYNSGDVVAITFRVRYLNENNQQGLIEASFENTIQNCGKVR